MSVNASKIPAGEALEVLRSGWKAQEAGEMTASWMLHGRPGVGKTMIVQQLADEIGAKLFDLRLTTIEPQDLRGLPYYDHDRKRTIWYRPEDLPENPVQPSILFLDELTAASPYLQPTVYGLLQERRVGRHVLPDTVMIIAAGNMAEDGAVAYEMGSALADRLVHMIVMAQAEDWLSGYALRHALHPAVTAFIRTRPDLLDTGEATLRRGQAIACTPRSWDRVSRIMQSVPNRAQRQIMIAGTVGEAAAAEFALIADDIAASVQIDEMLQTPRNRRKPLYPNSLHGLTALIYGLHAVTDERTLPSIIEILADIRHLSPKGLPLAELAHFGFETVIDKALANGWEQIFGTSQVYKDYAASRDALNAG